MGKVGRFACIFTPMVLSIASLICLLFVASGQTNQKYSTANDLYFFKANTANFTANPNQALDKVQLDNELLQALQGAASAKDLADFYKVGLWNYCEGKTTNGVDSVTYCSPKKSNFYFDPIQVWQLKNTTLQDVAEKKLQDGIDAYKKVAGWMFAAYIIAICLTAGEIVVGIFAVCSRWGSFATTIVSSAQTCFVFAAALTSTVLYSALAGVFDSVMHPYNIKATLGGKMLAAVWLAVAFSMASGFFWLISICCCSGKSPHKKTIVEKTPYTYERVASPYHGASEHGAPLLPPQGHTTSGSAYEPYRHGV